MTSKELLEHIKNAPAFKGGDSRYMGISNSASQYDNDIEQIKRDLEILDLIVENLHWQKAWYQNQAQYGHEEVSFCFSAFWSPDKYNKLKEWVEKKNPKKN